MALNNTAKLSDIITALQGMQGINQKADFKSALVTKGVNALDTDGVAELVNKLSSANLVLDGKKWASGNGMSNSSGVLTVSGLTFKPSVVIARGNGYSRLLTDTIYTPLATTTYQVGGTVTGTSSIAAHGTFTMNNISANAIHDWIAIE